MRGRCDDHHAFPATQARSRVLGDSFEKEGFVLVNLHEMVTARGRLQELSPVGRFAGVHGWVIL